MPRFNVLMVLADQHNASLFGGNGHSQVITPNFDAFAQSGTRFTNAYCQNPICTPSRVSILSGQYCHNHGYYGLSGPANFGLPNLMRHFKAGGYRTAGFGKLHLPNSPRNWLADDLDLFADTYESVDGEHGASPFLETLEALGLRNLEDSWHNQNAYGPASITQDAQPSQLPYEHTQEVWCARQAMNFIEQDPDTPFCIQIAFQKPHHPLLPNQRFWDLYPDNLDLPETYAVEPAARPPHFRDMWQRFRESSWDFGSEGEAFEEGARRAWRGTLACISQVDDVFGMLMRFLEEQGLADSTIVIYGSDHGAYHGIHGIGEKAPGICSDAVCRVPMLWRVPGVTRQGTACDALVENVDMAPTLASLCELSPMEAADGADITPLLQGKDAQPHTVAVTENPWSKAIRWKNWRMVHYPEDMFGSDSAETGELYDLDRDPQERRNLYADPECRHIVHEGHRHLLDWLIQTRRVVTSHPAVKSGEDTRSYSTYPICGDGSAPNRVQPHTRGDNNINYL